MHHITGESRTQITLFPEALEEYLSAENPVRFLDAYVEQLDMVAMGFCHAQIHETGRPPYHPKDLLKLYLYGYLNRIRSSRLLERETQRNLELFWLLQRLQPDHKTISDFRRKNAPALREVFKHFVVLCQSMELFGSELIAIDSTKFKASNARDRVKDQEQIDKSIAHITESIHQYLTQLDENDDKDKQTDAPHDLQKKIELLKSQQQRLQQATTDLQAKNQKYVSLTDADCRLMKNDRRIEPAYAMQTAVDAKHALIVDYELTQDANDNNHLACLATKAKEVLGVDTLHVCADAGYYDTVEMKACEDNRLTAYVPIHRPKISKKTNTPTPEYYAEKFFYDESSDTYRCPQGKLMQRFSRRQDKRDHRLIYLYRSSACLQCPVRTRCTTSPRGRYIYRWEHEAVLERLKQRMTRHPEIFQQRKAIIEPVFGTIKKVWGYYALLTKGIVNVAAELALMNLTYNIRRTLNIVGTKKLIVHLQHG